jgi:hypothetical protein
MKSMSNQTARLMLSALDCRDALRRLAQTITAAGNDPVRMAEALESARQIALTHGERLRAALKDNSARRHSAPEAKTMWASSQITAGPRRSPQAANQRTLVAKQGTEGR